jgi:hypothetical protein
MANHSRFSTSTLVDLGRSVLVTEGTIEEKLLATLSAKHDLALATLDMESDVKEVALASGIEELKRRLEVLLGANPHAAVDETEKQRQQQEAERLARRARVAEAGGQLLTAAFTLLGEMIPQHEPTNVSGVYKSITCSDLPTPPQAHQGTILAHPISVGHIPGTALFLSGRKAARRRR